MSADIRMDGTEQEIRIPLDGVTLDATLGAPTGTDAIIVFVHGSGSGRFSARNRAVASDLRDAGMATLLLDLLTPEEERIDRETARLRFDIGLLAARVSSVMDWLAGQRQLRHLRIGLFGASTGAAAALISAAQWPERVGAIVSRGGRPDLAGEHLRRVTVPTLLIVGGADQAILPLNQEALRALRGPKALVIIPGATHLFEEPGVLEAVAREAGRWFVRQLAPAGAAGGRAGEAW
ncbi:MAG TPA: dienelactone hydrolase family protein [Gemmatimonadaceae bacterium]|nr:dienelactone hydrolase family protein [Gemmatimonadaceae bacterium]